VPASVVKDSLIALEAEQTDLRARLDRAAPPPPLLHPNMADLYREKVVQLARGLEFEDSRIAASEALRGLIDAIVLTPEEGVLKIEPQGNLAAMLKAAQAPSSDGFQTLGRWEDERSPDTGDLVQIMLVAGGGFEPPTFGL
jgi:site-specific DNA recombinase